MAEAGGTLHNRIEHRLDVHLGLADDSEDLTGGSLSIESGYQIAIAGFQFLEQPHILDGDNGLVSEGLEQSNLSIAEGADLVPQQRDHTQSHIVSEQWHRQRRAVPSIRSLERLTFRELVVRHGADVVDVDGASVDERSPGDGSTSHRQTTSLEDLTLLSGCRDGADTRYDAKRIAVGDHDEEVGCVAERSPASHDRIEYRLHVCR